MFKWNVFLRLLSFKGLKTEHAPRFIGPCDRNEREQGIPYVMADVPTQERARPIGLWRVQPNLFSAISYKL